MYDYGEIPEICYSKSAVAIIVGSFIPVQI